MAKLFPENFPKGENPKDPEFKVFTRLSELPDRFSVIYSKKIKGGRNCKEETEIDFLIFDGANNLICLEVKGGEIAYSGPESSWYQNGKRMERSPDRQASAACHAIVTFLGKDAQRVNINWALAFPDCSRPAGGSHIPEVPDDLIVDSLDMLDISQAISKICDYNERQFNRQGVRRHQASAILERLIRSVGFVSKIGVRLIDDSAQLVKATQQQLDVLEDLELNEKTSVMGYAGTGKTIIATEFAKRSAEKGLKVLLLFYNRMVANTVRYGLGRETTIECMTFHSLARKVIEASAPSWWAVNASNKQQDFWETEAPLKMLEVLDSTDPQYDVIIVDEGQDFKNEWFETLEKLLIPSKESRFVVFYDGNQDIFGRWNSLPWQPESYTKKVLRKNCRNTKTIIDYLNSIIPSEMVGFENSPAGQPVMTKKPGCGTEAADILKSDIQLFLSEGVEAGKIVILINSPLAESPVSSIKQIGKYPVVWMGKSYRPDIPKIQVTNIQNFKGLEADVLLVTGINDKGDKSSPELLYTQASRARLLLAIYFSSDEKS